MDNGTTKFAFLYWPIFCIGMLLLLISLPQHVFQTLNPEGDYEDRCRGWEALLVGWFALLTGCFAWLANPMMLAVAVLLLFKKCSAALTVANIAVLCSLTTFAFFKPAPTGKLPESVLLDGAWFWFAAIACVWCSAFVAWRHHASTQSPDSVAQAKPD